MLTDCYGVCVCVCDNAITISFTLRISSIFNCLTTSFFFRGGGGEEITGNTMTRMVGMLTSVRFVVVELMLNVLRCHLTY